jgi:hypothetical protein
MQQDGPYPNAARAVHEGVEVINIYDGPEIFLDTFAQVRRDVGLLYATAFCQVEVCNGGLRQFFGNSTGVLAPEAVEGFLAIGQPKTADIVSRAMAHFGEPYPRDRNTRKDLLWKLPENIFHDLDQEFFGLTDVEGGGISPASERYAISRGL